jgi:hypothetical protein
MDIHLQSAQETELHGTLFSFAVLIRRIVIISPGDVASYPFFQSSSLCQVACQAFLAIFMNIVALCNDSEAVSEKNFVDQSGEECRWHVY